jgi:hypothetical protein
MIFNKTVEFSQEKLCLDIHPFQMVLVSFFLLSKQDRIKKNKLQHRSIPRQAYIVGENLSHMQVTGHNAHSVNQYHSYSKQSPHSTLR